MHGVYTQRSSCGQVHIRPRFGALQVMAAENVRSKKWQHAHFLQLHDDLGFVSQFGSVHSLKATAAFGNFAEASLSRPINIGWIKAHLNYNRLRNIWAVNDPLNEIIYITASWDASTTNNTVLAMDYRRAPDVLAWSKITAYSMASLGLFVDTSGLRRILGGGNDGYVRRLNIASRKIDTATAIAYKITTPSLNYGNPMVMKTLERASVGINPKGNFTSTFAWTRDSSAQQTNTFTQGAAGGDVLGTSSASQFTLGTSTLGGNQYIDNYFELETGGEFRSIQYEVSDGVVSQDIEVHSLTAAVTVGVESTENL